MALSDCAILSGITNDCDTGRGGLKTVYFCPLSDKTSSTVITSASGAITNVATFLSTGKKFWTFQLKQNTSNYAQVIKASNRDGTFYVEQTLNVKFTKFSAFNSYVLKALFLQPQMVIAERQDGTLILLGETNGMNGQDSNQPGGVAMADFNGYDFTFKAEEPNMANTLTSSLRDLLIVNA
jgi:hypothetical protein